MKMFIVAIAKTQKHSVGEEISKLWYIQTGVLFSAKKNMSYEKTCWKLKCILLSERS